MNPSGAAAEQEGRPIARLQLRKVPVAVPRERAPVFHFFEEMYARSGGGETGARRPPADP